MIGFSCPHCGAALKVDESMSGKTGPCPSCSQAVRVPTAGQTSTVRGSGHRTLPDEAGEEASDVPGLAPPPDYPFLAPAQGPDELGRLGPYRVLKVLGTGAMGVVFEAEDAYLKRMVALKVMRPSLAASGDYHRRFLREAQLSAAIEHEHVVPVYQVGEDRGIPFMAMKLLRGETLEDRLNRTGGRLSLPEVLRVGREIAEGLAAAHARGLIHRDIKPANVWLEAGGDRVKIVDFGLARGTGEDAHFTQAGAVIGTPAYMAPEQANAEEVDARCDLFSLGAVLYRAGTGRMAFAGKDTLSVLRALALQTPEPPHEVDPSLPRGFSDLVMRLLAKDRAGRPKSAREVAEAIEALERGEEPEAPPASPPEAAPPPPAPEPERARAGVESESGVKRKKPKKLRPHAARKAKQPEGKDRGWVVLVVSLVLLGVAVLVLLIAVIRHATKAHAAAVEDPAPTLTAQVGRGLSGPPFWGSVRQNNPSCSRAASVMRSCVHGGSNTTSTLADATPGMARTFDSTSGGSDAAAGHAGDVSVIWTLTAPGGSMAMS
ncbi:MAG TPA: serine/threonine-protein kinase [Gemmataceae bacterium]|nr:serine/threonine-protein kinase [Gemmataceae bacterium]